ncbi:hypothetical protein HJG60_007977 [Phyllostomus discolor]|uniref:Uncharacterized protein n=1 Tax=Phyllostomus discolor TaxID=89673 RepID=A0A834EVR0_9CHIR|nr:hypothetical protein HJG60_007977 [Phyllostomus discolor]
MFKLNEKFDADLLLYLLSHFECKGHTVHMLTQQCLPPPLTSTVMLSLFTHTHSSPPSWAARLHGYMDVTQNILSILTIVGLFPDRPDIKKINSKCTKDLTARVKSIKLVKENIEVLVLADIAQRIERGLQTQVL